jgi:hypothetical protein
MTNSFANEKALIRYEVESFYSENMEKLKADYDGEKSKGEAIFRTVEERKSVVSKKSVLSLKKQR